jgi:hypothetical protein
MTEHEKMLLDLLSELYERTLWMTGSHDFSEDGIARGGYINYVKPCLDKVRDLLNSIQTISNNDEP